MTTHIIDFSKYRAKLDQIKKDVTQDKEESKRDLILSLVSWFDSKVEEWEAKRLEYKAAVNDLERINNSKYSVKEQEIVGNYLNHLKTYGRLLYLFQSITIIYSEGDGWQTDPKSTKAVLDIVLDLYEEK